jgi:hypothetical protein
MVKYTYCNLDDILVLLVSKINILPIYFPNWLFIFKIKIINTYINKKNIKKTNKKKDDVSRIIHHSSEQPR